MAELSDESMSEEEYNELPGLRSTALKYFMQWGPRAYHQKYVLNVFEPDKENDCLRFGKILHELVIEGKRDWEVWEGGRRAGAEWNGFKEGCEAEGKLILLPKEERILELMLDSVMVNEQAVNLLNRTVRREQVVQFKYKGLACKCRFDMWLDNDGIADPKSCRDPTAEGFFFKGVDQFSYHIQAEFYKMGAQNYLESDRPIPFHFIAIENKEPYRCAVHTIHYQVRDSMRDLMYAALDELVECYERDEWREPLSKTRAGVSITQEYSPNMFWYAKKGINIEEY